MAAFVETYNASMRAALFRAAIDDGHGVKGALELAQAGRLPDLDVASQHVLGGMAYAYAASMVKTERDSRETVKHAYADIREAAHDTARRLAALATREVGRLEAAPKKTPVNTDAATKAAKLMREALALAREADAKANARQRSQSTRRSQGAGRACHVRGSHRSRTGHRGRRPTHMNQRTTK